MQSKTTGSDLRIVRAVVWAGLDVDEGPLAHRQLGGGQLHTTPVPPWKYYID